MSVYESPAAATQHPYLAALRQWWPILVGGALIGALLGWGVSQAATPSYKSTATLYFSLSAGDSGNDLNQGSTYTQSQMLSFAELAGSDTVLAPVIQALDLDVTPKELSNQLEVSTPQNTVILQVTVSSGQPAQAASIANEIAKSVKRAVADVAPRSSETNLTTVAVRTIQPAGEAFEASSPNTRVNVLAGLLVGLIIAMLTIIIRERLNPSVRSAGAVRALTSSPVLGVIAKEKGDSISPALLRSPRSAAAEAYRQLRTSVAHTTSEISPLCLLVTSSIDREGKSTVASNLALAFGEVGNRVVIVDAELRSPKIAQIAGIADEPGLSSILSSTRRPLGSIRKMGLGSVDVITAGALPSNPTALLSKPSVATLFSQLRQEYDVIIVDTPPAGHTTDAAILAVHADGVIVVADRRRLHAPQFTGALESLELAGAVITGIVVNETRRGSRSSRATDASVEEAYRPNTTSGESAPSDTVTTTDDDELALNK